MKMLFLVVICFGLIACDPLEPTAPRTPEEGAQGGSPATGAAKPTAPVDLDYQLHERGGGFELELTVRSSHPDAPIHASLRDEDGVLLVAPQPVVMTWRDSGREGALRFFVSEDSYAGGLLVQLDVEMEGGTLSRSAALPAGPSAASTSRAMHKALSASWAEQTPTVVEVDAAGAAVISLPAEEVSTP